MGDRSADDRSQRIEEKPRIKKGEPGRHQRHGRNQQAAGQSDGGTDEGRHPDEQASEHGDHQDFQPVRPVGPREKAAGEDLLDGLRMQRNAGNVLAERGDADVLQAGRRCPDEDDAAVDGGGDIWRGPVGRKHLPGGYITLCPVGVT